MIFALKELITIYIHGELYRSIALEEKPRTLGTQKEKSNTYFK